jgi:mRNA-degrading endonuclease RelE of RelBE toxin-antitoxin system
MQISWQLTALAFFDQLSTNDRGKIEQQLERLAKDWDQQEPRRERLTGLSSKDGHSIFSLRAGPDFRVLFYRPRDRILVVDIVRHSQIERLRSGR